jgi:hypothetical protein
MIKILKKPAGSIRFQFYKLEAEKTEPKPKKPKPNRLNWFFVLKNRIKTSQFKLVSVFKKN